MQHTINEEASVKEPMEEKNGKVTCEQKGKRKIEMAREVKKVEFVMLF